MSVDGAVNIAGARVKTAQTHWRTLLKAVEVGSYADGADATLDRWMITCGAEGEHGGVGGRGVSIRGMSL